MNTPRVNWLPVGHVIVLRKGDEGWRYQTRSTSISLSPVSVEVFANKRECAKAAKQELRHRVFNTCRLRLGDNGVIHIGFVWRDVALCGKECWAYIEGDSREMECRKCKLIYTKLFALFGGKRLM